VVGLTRTELLELAETVGERRAVEIDGDVAGYVWLEVRERILHIHALLLRREFRGHGIGGRTLQALEDEFGGAVDEVELGVHEANRRARALYERSGFREVERRHEIGCSIMRKSLIAENP
jgi:ribosomal protein S18 acetylase RimI-like enzyme